MVAVWLVGSQEQARYVLILSWATLTGSVHWTPTLGESELFAPFFATQMTLPTTGIFSASSMMSSRVKTSLLYSWSILFNTNRSPFLMKGLLILCETALSLMVISMVFLQPPPQSFPIRLPACVTGIEIAAQCTTNLQPEGSRNPIQPTASAVRVQRPSIISCLFGFAPDASSARHSTR